MAEDTYSYRHQVARELTAMRLQAGLSRTDVCDQTGWSGAKLSRVESGVRMPIAANALLLVHMYGATAAQRDHIMDLVHLGRQPASCEAFADLLSTTRMEYYERLLTTDRIAEFSASVIPHLLRTDTYCAQLRRHEIPDQDLDRCAEFDRFVRQPRKARIQTYIINESALWRLVGGTAGMREQLALLSRTQRTLGTDIRIIPFSAGPAGADAGAFTIMNEGESALGVIHFPYMDPTFERQPKGVSRLQDLFNWLTDMSVPLDVVMPQALARLA